MSDAEDFLEHFGVRGMKWGKRKAEESSVEISSGSPSKTTKSGETSSGGSSPKAAPAKLKGQAKRDTDSMQAAIDAYYAKQNPAALRAGAVAKKKAQSSQVMDHVGPDGKKVVTEDNPKESGMSKKQKVLLGVGAGVAIAGLAYYGNQQAKKASDINSLLGDWDDTGGGVSKLKGANKDRVAAQHRAQLDSLFPGGTASSNPHTAGDGFYAGLRNGRAKDRPEFTISKDTVFQRLSDHQETGKDYGKGTYATFLTNDNKHYGGSYEFGGKSYTLGFRPKEDVRVPSFKTVMDTVKEMGHDTALKRAYTDDEATSLYHTIAGGNWSSPSNAKLIDGLKKKGYSAIVDDMDAGYLGDLPMVFFGETDAVSAVPRASGQRKKDKSETVDLDRRYG